MPLTNIYSSTKEISVCSPGSTSSFIHFMNSFSFSFLCALCVMPPNQNSPLPPAVAFYSVKDYDVCKTTQNQAQCLEKHNLGLTVQIQSRLKTEAHGLSFHSLCADSVLRWGTACPKSKGEKRIFYVDFIKGSHRKPCLIGASFLVQSTLFFCTSSPLDCVCR